jgi:hypothetical protein
LREVAVDAPITRRIGIGERIACNAARYPQVIKLGALSAQARFDVAQALTIGQLCEGHAQVLIKAGEPLDLVFTGIAGNAAMKCLKRQMIHHRRENKFAQVHPSPRKPNFLPGRVLATFKSTTSKIAVFLLVFNGLSRSHR